VRIKQNQQGYLLPLLSQLLSQLKGHDAPQRKTSQKIRTLWTKSLYLLKVACRHVLDCGGNPFAIQAMRLQPVNWLIWAKMAGQRRNGGNGEERGVGTTGLKGDQ